MPLDYDALVGARFAPQRQSYSTRDSILYALSVGVGALRPHDPDELLYIYERGLAALPTMALTLAPPISWLSDPRFGITYNRILHAEQFLTLHKPLPAQGGVVSEARIDGVFDKGVGAGAIVHLARRLLDERTGDLLASMTYALFMLDDGGFGGVYERPERLRPVTTERPCDLSVTLPASANQALLYRLTGDIHPLHIDPEVARSAGFARPILHGLCAYGMVGRAIVETLCDNDPSRLLSLDTRFTNPVFPGEPLELQLWREGPERVAFRLLAVDRGVVVQDMGRAGFRP
ncbi:MaoC family dehydratase N-terminal domain-containing protein [Sphingopyxis granuli]|uniref:MaoC/PaaZ C-terminal domain-containing protein n=1 Tax=Sphingopyxis granuli TaxID=267128 RepID=UPI001F538F3A|nr:MaoC/PaaZ C-terminal domain-containing protein [Sphingopyxis granuli]UNK80572.1 MaoC family dehydratase N-terminal domain-containing protein [Sphingopyxis granuli]